MIPDEIFRVDMPNMTYAEFARKHGISPKNARKRAIKLGIKSKKYVMTTEHRQKLSQNSQKMWDEREDPKKRKARTKQNRRVRSARRRKERWHDENDDYRSKKHELYKSRRRSNIKWLLRLKMGLKCIKCGEDHVSCLDFHHKDPSTKSFNISRAILDGVSKKQLLQEIAKCDVLCANCHRKHHWSEDDSNTLQRTLLKEIQNENP